MNGSSITFTRPDGSALPPMHHLSLNPRKKYALQVSITRDPKHVGERVIIQLRTGDATVALLKRDCILEAYQKAGLLCREIVLTGGEM